MNRSLQNMVVASLLAMFAVTVSAQEAPQEGRARTQVKREVRFPNVKLMTETGAEVRFVDDLVKDKVVIINFMYTECDDLCEKVTRNLQQVQKALGPRLGKDVFIYSVTLDPKNDTPEVLNTYRDNHATNVGWHYLWGEADDIAALRRGTGMTAMSPELRKKLKLAPLNSNKNIERQHSGMLLVGNERTGEWQKVDALSRPDHILQIVESMIAAGDAGGTGDAAAAGNAATPGDTVAAPKIINANAGSVWQPRSQNVVVGDVLEWRMNDNTGATNPEFPGHGVRITNWAAVKDHVEVVTVPGQIPFSEITGKNDTESKTVGQVLLRLKVTSAPTGAAINYNCTFHGISMAGKVTVAGAVVATPAAATPKTVNANAGSVWQPRSQNVVVGDVIEWKMNDNTGATSPEFPGHGVRITNWAAVKDHVEVVTVPGQIPFSEITGKNDTESKTVGQVLLRLKVKSAPPGAARINYNCTFHGISMAGTVSVSATPAVPSPAGEGDSNDFLEKLSPSMQRRLLRFVNQAYQSEDLMKSPQEFRARSEHVAVNRHKNKSDAKSGFPRAMADALISGRPVDGFRDIRECLPIYKSSGRLEDLGGVLESVGPGRFGSWDDAPGRIPSVMHAALMHTGKVLLLTDSLDTVVWDPASGPQVLPGSVTGLTDILYCSGHAFLSDGRLLVVGGGGGSAGEQSSIHAWTFTPSTLKWARTDRDMAFRRWYPTLVRLGDEPGRVLVAAGSMGSSPAPQMEVYSESTDRFETITATGPVGDLLFEPTYPGLHLLPGGEIFHAPTGFNDCDQAPITSSAVADRTAIFRFTSSSSGSWTRLGANNRLKGMSVLLFDTSFPFVQGLVAGGGESAKNGTAQTINLSSMSPAWSPTFPLHEPRVHPNLVVLPDGTVFICGGKEAAATPPPRGGKCELFNPRTGLTAEMDELNVPRHYHSVALLLPDARVMIAGGADDGGCTVSTRPTVEIFSPPYLFQGARPLIASATGFVDHGATIEIKTPAASEIQRVVLVRPAAVTHQTDSEQRVLPLSFQVTGADTIEAKAPGGPGANPIAPTGHYMLFILNQQGVPSVSKWVLLQ